MTETLSEPWDIQAGEPFDRSIRLVDGKNLWPTIGLVEVRSQLREKEEMPSSLVFDFSQYYSLAYDGNDIIATLHLSGNETRNVKKSGWFDVFFSDAGATDEQSIRAFKGQVTFIPAYTSGS